MDPNSGKIYKGLTDEQAARLGLVPVSKEVADMVEVGAAAMALARSKVRDTQATFSKEKRRKKAKAARTSRKANR